MSNGVSYGLAISMQSTLGGRAGVSMRNSGRALISCGLGNNKWGNYTFGNPVRTTRKLFTSYALATDLVLHYVNCAPGQITGVSLANQPSGPFWMKASMLPYGTSTTDVAVTRIPVFFGGKRWIKVNSLADIRSDVLPIVVGNGEQYFIHTCVGGHPAPLLAAPTSGGGLAGSGSGGSMAAGDYRVRCSAVYLPYLGDGPDETVAGNVSATVTLSGTTSSIAVPQPAAPSAPYANTIGWNVYVEFFNTTTQTWGPPLLSNPTPLLWVASSPPGYTVTIAPASTSQQAIVSSPSSGVLQGSLGEGGTSSSDATDTGSIGGSDAFGFVPIAVSGRTAGSSTTTVELMGDSIEAGARITAIGGVKTDKNGGGTARYLLAHGIPYVMFAQGGEKAQNIGNPGGYVSLWNTGSLASHVIDDLWTNDLSATSTFTGSISGTTLTVSAGTANVGAWISGSGITAPCRIIQHLTSTTFLLSSSQGTVGSETITQTNVALAQLQVWRLQIALRAIMQGQIYIGKTCRPTTQEGTSVAWTQVSGQIQQVYEPLRVAINPWWRSASSAQTVVSAEIMVGTANASNKLFYFKSGAYDISQPLAIQKDGATLLYGTDYIYAPQLRAGNYLAGIYMISAPAAASQMTSSGTVAPGGLAAAPGAACWDVCPVVEVNASNVTTQDGGYCRAAGAQFFTGTLASSGAVTTDSTLQISTLLMGGTSPGWTTDSLIGYTLRKGSPGSLAAASGNSWTIYGNGANTLQISSTNSFANSGTLTLYGPDGSALLPYFSDGLHLTDQALALEAATIPTDQLARMI